MITLTLALLLILAAPLCASMAGVVVWAAHRNETAADGELVTHFLAQFAIFAVRRGNAFPFDLVERVSRARAVRINDHSDAHGSIALASSRLGGSNR